MDENHTEFVERFLPWLTNHFLVFCLPIGDAWVYWGGKLMFTHFIRLKHTYKRRKCHSAVNCRRFHRQLTAEEINYANSGFCIIQPSHFSVSFYLYLNHGISKGNITVTTFILRQKQEKYIIFYSCP